MFVQLVVKVIKIIVIIKLTLGYIVVNAYINANIVSKSISMPAITRNMNDYTLVTISILLINLKTIGNQKSK
jgi:hypothetical protein